MSFGVIFVLRSLHKHIFLCLTFLWIAMFAAMEPAYGQVVPPLNLPPADLDIGLHLTRLEHDSVHDYVFGYFINNSGYIVHKAPTHHLDVLVDMETWHNIPLFYAVAWDNDSGARTLEPRTPYRWVITSSLLNNQLHMYDEPFQTYLMPGIYRMRHSVTVYNAIGGTEYDLTAVFTVPFSSHRPFPGDITMLIDGTPRVFELPPTTIDGSVMLPLSSFARELGF